MIIAGHANPRNVIIALPFLFSTWVNLLSDVQRRHQMNSSWTKKEEGCVPELLTLRRNRYLLMLCRRKPVLAKSLLSGLREAVRECQYQMKHNRWNCCFDYQPSDYTLLNDPPIVRFGSDDQSESVMAYWSSALGYKEASFFVALSSAGAAWSVAKACANGRLASCSCNVRQESSQQAWKWGGCSYSIKYGLLNSRKLLISKPTSWNTNLMRIVYRQNLKAGRMALKKTLRKDCKCHGVSGSCQLKTCWKSPAEFREIGKHLKHKLSKAKFLLQNHSPNDSRFIGQKLRSAELVYFEHSPSYCEPLSYIRSVGTKGRVCNVRNQTHNLGDCKAICCGRGYYQQAETVYENCNCKFYWCCRVTCEKCRRTKWVSKCL